MKILIIIPAYNEEKRIGKTLRAFLSFIEDKKQRANYSSEILVMINGTKDKTEEVVKSIQKSHKKLKYLNLKEAGKGFAIKEGFKIALKEKFDLVGYVDADLATTPGELFKLVDNIGENQGIVANRYSKNSKIIPSFTFVRWLISRVYNFLIKSLFFINYQDTQCGAKVFRRQVIEQIIDQLEISNWAFEVNILHICKVKGFRVAEIPTVWFEVKGGHLNVIRTSIQMFFSIIQLRLLKSPARKTLKVVSPLIGIIYKVLSGK